MDTSFSQLFSIVKLVQQYIPLKKKNNLYWGNCPFHEEKTASFAVNDIKGFFYCFGCHKSGNGVTFVKDFEKVESPQAIEKIAKTFKLKVKIPKTPQISIDHRYEILKDVIGICYQQLLVSQNPLAYLLNTRNLSMDIIEYFQMGWCNNNLINEISMDKLQEVDLLSDSQKLFFHNRIIIPIHNVRGIPVGFGARTIFNAQTCKYINSRESSIFLKSCILFNLHRVTKYNEIYIVEGYMDVITMHAHGVTNVVANMGTASSTEKVELLNRYVESVILFFDNDTSGKEATYKYIECLLQSSSLKIKVVNYNYKDPDEYFNKVKNPPLETINFEMWIWEYLLEKYNINSSEIMAVHDRYIIKKHIDMFISNISNREIMMYTRQYFYKLLHCTTRTQKVINVYPTYLYVIAANSHLWNKCREEIIQFLQTIKPQINKDSNVYKIIESTIMQGLVLFNFPIINIEKIIYKYDNVNDFLEYLNSYVYCQQNHWIYKIQNITSEKR